MYRLATLLCLIALAWAAPVAAQTPIHRCIGANGSAVFTDQPCAALQATPASRVVASAPAVAATTAPTLCAASLGALRQGVIDAFASHDANRLAGMMLWDGYGRGAAIADIQSLTRLMKQPLLDVKAPDESAAAPAAASSLAAPFAMNVDPAPTVPAHNQLVVHTADSDGNGNPRELRFDIVHQAGCLWLRNAD